MEYDAMWHKNSITGGKNCPYNFNNAKPCIRLHARPGSKCNMLFRIFQRKLCIPSKGESHRLLMKLKHFLTCIHICNPDPQFATVSKSLLFSSPSDNRESPYQGINAGAGLCWACWEGSVPRPPLWWIQQSVRNST